MDSLQDRLTNLEILYSHQVELVEELNQEVIECNARIDQLIKEHGAMREMLQSLAPEMTESPDE
ncbi:MAG: SlyX protein [Desulfuromonas sp.]|nr:MAG: SlyX protein [Desulfuromonas sp.]